MTKNSRLVPVLLVGHVPGSVRGSLAAALANVAALTNVANVIVVGVDDLVLVIQVGAGSMAALEGLSGLVSSI